MGNVCVFSLISHNLGKDSHRMGKSGKLVPCNILKNPLYVENLENWYSYFSQVWVLFSARLPSYKLLHHMGNAWVFSSNFPLHSEIHQNGECLGTWFPYFFHKMGVFFPLDSHPAVYLIIWGMHGFSHQLPKT